MSEGFLSLGSAQDQVATHLAWSHLKEHESICFLLEYFGQP